MSSIKYIAAGFLEDSENLLNAFVQENSTNFSVFTTKWKEHNFGLIFSGRDKEELQQFTNEIFQLTLGYLENGSIILQIGAVYLLYALYRNQKSKPVVQIRITLTQLNILRKLKNLSEKNRYIHLHYIINFLCANAFEFVEKSVLFGPCCTNGKTEIEKEPFNASLMLKDDKTEIISFHNSNILKEIKVLSDEYAQLGRKLLPNKGSELSEIGEYVEGLESLINDETSKTKLTKKSVVDVGLGNRRANIKANQFSKKALFRQLNPSDSDEDYEPVEEKKDAITIKKPIKGRPKKRRVAKEKRRVGRPKKFDLEKLLETDESDHGPKVKEIRRRGPIQRGSYTAKYELKVPDFDMKMFKDFMQDCTSSETSEEESTACKKENDDTQDITPDKVEGAYCNGYPKAESSEEEYAACKEATDNIQDITSYKVEEECSDEDPDDPDSNETQEIYSLF